MGSFFTHFASGQIPYYPIVAISTACLKFPALVFLIASSLAQSVSRYVL
jgi:hypothetical protein